MAMKTIRVSEEIYRKLSHLGLESETYNDVIARLIDAYEDIYLDDFTDEEANYYNERIRRFEVGITRELGKLICMPKNRNHR